MGHYEAIRDGIRHSKTGFNNYYYPLCQYCGKEVVSFGYIAGRKYTCQECKLEKKLADKQLKNEDMLPVKQKKLEIAIKRIRKIADIEKYDHAIKVVESKLETHGWFDSTEEIMVALELIRKKIKARHQVKMGTRYRADFVLPEMKIVLEVDGKIFHAGERKKRERLRDDLILLALGPEWEVVRITDDLINQDITKLLPAINKLVAKRKWMRKENNGEIPRWYSDGS